MRRIVHSLALLTEPDPFSTRWEDSPRGPVLVVAGSLDALTAPRLSAAICALGRERVAVDVGGVRAIEPGALRDVLLAARVVGTELHLVCPSGAPGRRALTLARTGRPVAVHATRASALEAVGRSRRPAAA
jgi:hypothetical protein